MGIPYYFSYIIRNCPEIIKKIKNNVYSHLYMDCNSIIYDTYNKIAAEIKNNLTVDELEDFIITKTFEKIEEYIRYICPSKTIYIAFDGVAPFAKMEQQRSRRYKNTFLANITESGEITECVSKWSTIEITPGTAFMTKLTNFLKTRFYKGCEPNYGARRLVFSGADERGEGEHKMFMDIRNHPCLDDTIAVYGLDSDLIMLSIFHYKKYCKNIHIFREAPEFMRGELKSILMNESETQMLLLNIEDLANKIVEMIVGRNANYVGKRQNITEEYLLICMMVGNDFLPKIESLNLRNGGMERIIHEFRNYKKMLIKDGNILWNHMIEFIKRLAKTEYEILKENEERRNKMEKRRVDKLNDVPMKYREKERYINMMEDGWETRYNRVFFGDEAIERVVEKYKEGVEWVYEYYTSECVDSKWLFGYGKAPLLIDIAKSGFKRENKKQKYREGFSEIESLAYIMPKEGVEIKFDWSYRRYLWESEIVIGHKNNIMCSQVVSK